MNKIEKHILNGEHCMGVFLDIQAAFDSIKPEHIKNALLKHGCHPDMVDWYYELITHRNVLCGICHVESTNSTKYESQQNTKVTKYKCHVPESTNSTKYKYHASDT